MKTIVLALCDLIMIGFKYLAYLMVPFCAILSAIAANEHDYAKANWNLMETLLWLFLSNYKIDREEGDK